MRIGQPTDRITRTEYVPIKEFFKRIMGSQKIWIYNPTARNPRYRPNESWSNEFGYGKYFVNGGAYGKVKVQYYIPSGCRSERVRVMGFAAEDEQEIIN